MRAIFMFDILFLCCLGLMIFACATESGRKIVVTAHRGASGLAPENTIAAMLKAIEYESDFSELDVQETKDGQLILLHDDDLQRTTNDSGPIWEKTYADLQGVDAGSWMSPEFAGEPIPLFSSVIDTVKGKMKLNIEIKINNHQQDLERRVVNLIEEKDFADQCIVTSFNRPTVEKVKELNPNLKVGLIFSKWPVGDIYNNNWSLLSVNAKLVDREFVEKAHQAGKEVHVWTVNEPEDMKRMMDYGVDNIITNRPDVLQDVLKNM